MYQNSTLRTGRAMNLAVALAATTCLGAQALVVHGQQMGPSVVRNISRATERLEMTVNTSQILTLGTRIPRLVVNNPELVTATPISETQIQIAARKPGVTQINLWDESGNVYTVDLLIFGDVRELEMVLKQMFPMSTIKVTRLTNSLVLDGQVDNPEIVSNVFRLAEDYAPKIVSNLSVGGVQQVILKVKVMEVSRNKLRRLGADFSFGSGGSAGGVEPRAVASGISQLLNGTVGAPDGPTFGVFGNDMEVFIEALQQRRVAKLLADPTLVAISGRAARFQVGGQVPVPVPQPGSGGQGGTIGIEYKDFGTIIDFVPLVLSNGRIRLEVRPDMSELDYLNAVNIAGTLVPGFKKQVVDTGVEMNAGQTLAIAGLIQEKIVSQNRGVPYVSDIPIVGVPFRKVSESVDEIESLVLVTPDFADAMDPHEVPQCGPGMETMSPSNCELYWRGQIEVPACGPCGASQPCQCTAPGLRCQNGALGGPAGAMPYGMPYGPAAMATDGMMLNRAMPMNGAMQPPVEMLQPTPAQGFAPQGMAPEAGPQFGPTLPGGEIPPDPAATRGPHWQGGASAVTSRQVRSGNGRPGGSATSTPGLIGPIGYDVQK